VHIPDECCEPTICYPLFKYNKKNFINSKRINMSTPLELLNIQRWMKDAACKGNTEGDWFPEAPGNAPAVKIALSICKDCLVKQECYDYAITRPELQGIWGGVTARKRGRIRAEGNKSE
jgi:WhiB family redox-sensing transcriptional regulator